RSSKMKRWHMNRVAYLIGVGLLFASISGRAWADTYVIHLDPELGATPQSGRLIVFFITETSRSWTRAEPRRAPFFNKPQPIASVQVDELKPGEAIRIETFESMVPIDLGELEGPVRIQALLDIDQTERGHNQGPGNLYSEVVEVELTRGDDDVIELTLVNRIPPRKRPQSEHENLVWVEFKSELLSDFYGRDIHHRAGVALPLPYLNKDHPRQEWPAIYVIPGYGGREGSASDYALMFRQKGVEDIAPMGVTIVLDPESPLGHHGFVDSPNHGPRGQALVTELIPYLEKRFRLVARPEARIVTGHSSGGWSSLWLQLRRPETFGACWSTAPDPVDFSAFQMTDLYVDENIYVNSNGEPTPSMRRLSGPRGQSEVMMTVCQEGLMEWALHPEGGSGQQWDAWEAMFSPPGPPGPPGSPPGNPDLNFPVAMFDPQTGKIDKAVVEHWRAFDITHMVESDWATYGPIVNDNVRLMCGEQDSYYLNRAVQRFKAMVEAKRENEDGAGYVMLVPFADHGTLREFVFQRINEEMRTHLRKHGLHD
ncbi:MAG: alpha/beta hydrolase-fold protein, partial [Planctomycetota bacterium]|nr:alpha/beta hydrolase-fold protein [Planctomycetota bacterium]